MAGLPWIKLYRDLPGHEKSRKLAKFTGNLRAWTHVVELWLWAASNQADGDMSYTPDAAIGIAAGWYDKPERFAAALREAGFLDPDGMLHGWEEEQASHAERLRKDRDRKAKSRGPPDDGSAGQSTGTSIGHTDTPPERPQDSPPDLPLRAKILDLESRDSAREEISIKIPAAVADGVQPNLFAAAPEPSSPEKQTKPKRPKAEPSGCAADREAFRDFYRQQTGQPEAEFSRAGFSNYAATWKASGFGPDSVMEALPTLLAEPFHASVSIDDAVTQRMVNKARAIEAAKGRQSAGTDGDTQASRLERTRLEQQMREEENRRQREADRLEYERSLAGGGQ